ncbi:MAG TPA: hypothetical protein VGM19_07585 [Armatimonadota bacterium]|jgi:hypothetical protein
MRTTTLILVACLLLLVPLAASWAQDPPAPPGTSVVDAPLVGPPAPAPPAAEALELRLYHNPTCHTCQMIVGLQKDMEALDPELKITLLKISAPGAQEDARRWRALAKVEAEFWGPAVAVFAGDKWATPQGQKLLDGIHQLLADRLEIIPKGWVGDTFTAQEEAKTKVEILGELRRYGPRNSMQHGLRQGLQLGGVVALLVLLSVLVAAGGTGRRVGLSGLLFGLGLFVGRAVLVVYSLPAAVWQVGESLVALLLTAALAVVWTGFTISAYRRHRRQAAAPPAEAGEAASTAPATTGVFLVALPLGLLAGILAHVMSDQTVTQALADAWRLPGIAGDVRERILAADALFTVSTLAPCLVVTLLAGLLAGLRSVRAWAAAQPRELSLVRVLMFGLGLAYLLSQLSVQLMNRLPAG